MSEIDESEAFMYVQSLKHLLFLWFSAIIALILVVAFFFSRSFAKPIVYLSEVAQKVGKGELDQKVEIRAGGHELQVLAKSFNDMITGLKERDFVKDTFNRYMTKQVADEILNNPDAIVPGGKKQEVTILFSDIRGFTSFSENLFPEEVVSRLNEYMASMVDVIIKHDGVVDKFIGDAIMAIYGDRQSSVRMTH